MLEIVVNVEEEKIKMSVHFHRYFISLAENLIQMKSTSDDVKALNDLNEINYTLANTQPPQEFVQRAKELDKRINDDYPEIIQMYKIGRAHV